MPSCFISHLYKLCTQISTILIPRRAANLPETTPLAAALMTYDPNVRNNGIRAAMTVSRVPKGLLKAADALSKAYPQQSVLKALEIRRKQHKPLVDNSFEDPLDYPPSSLPPPVDIQDCPWSGNTPKSDSTLYLPFTLVNASGWKEDDVEAALRFANLVNEDTGLDLSSPSELAISGHYLEAAHAIHSLPHHKRVAEAGIIAQFPPGMVKETLALALASHGLYISLSSTKTDKILVDEVIFLLSRLGKLFSPEPIPGLDRKIIHRHMVSGNIVMDY